ncbi:MAG: sigma-54 dependent transcriptional regulator [Polyangiaceae bacterium]|jgi:two-component system response regulator HydG
MQSRVLIVDDDRDTRLLLDSLLSSDGHACELASDAASAMALVDSRRVDVVVSDVIMEGMSGLDLLDRFKQSHPALPVVLITAAGAVPHAVDAIKRGAFQYVVKPCDSKGLQRIVRDALETRRHRTESPRPSPPPLPFGGFDLVGSGPAMTALRTNIDLVARSSAPVLVTGETGAGKELVARAIHARSNRSRRPFVAVNMSAIPKELMEAEIFGHVRGAFTGAVQPRKGLFTEADGGTLLLDEIGDISFLLQAKLLRVLQSGAIRPVGSEREHHVDVRVIAATHRNLPALVTEGRFREDLFFRLNVLPVLVPPLRHRREDIPALAERFLAEARQRAPHSPVRSLRPDVLRMLSEAPWPGNVRELASCIERAVVFGVEAILDVESVRFRSDEPTLGWPFPSNSPWTLRRLSRAYTEWVLAETGGNKERAAEILGIDVSTLYRWRRADKD